jgi:hypothetical protein
VKRLLTVAVIVLSGCSAAARRDARTALDVVQIACVIANAESDDATVREICRIANALLPDVKHILAEQRAASRRFANEHAARCRDGGSDDAKRSK